MSIWVLRAALKAGSFFADDDSGGQLRSEAISTSSLACCSPDFPAARLSDLESHRVRRGTFASSTERE